MKDITWSWIGGFVQAEGSVGPRSVSVSQKDREPLELIRDFFISETSCVVFPEVYKDKSRDNPA